MIWCGCTSWSPWSWSRSPPGIVSSGRSLGVSTPGSALRWCRRTAARARNPRLFPDHAGAGLAFELPRHATLYGFAEATLDAGPSLDHSVAFGPGAALGLWIGSEADRWRAHAFARTTYYALGDTTPSVSAGVEQRLTLGRNSALELETSFERDFGRSWARALLSWNWFF